MKVCPMTYVKKRKRIITRKNRNWFWKVHSLFFRNECIFNCWSALFGISEKGKNHFEVLPEGWLQVTHNSGLPIYMHKASRVCSVSRPYFLGPGSLRVCAYYIVEIGIKTMQKIETNYFFCCRNIKFQ